MGRDRRVYLPNLDRAGLARAGLACTAIEILKEIAGAKTPVRTTQSCRSASGVEVVNL